MFTEKLHYREEAANSSCKANADVHSECGSKCFTNCISERRRTLKRWSVRKVVFAISIIMLIAAPEAKSQWVICGGNSGTIVLPTGECLHFQISCMKDMTTGKCLIDGWCHIVDCDKLPGIEILQTETFTITTTDGCNWYYYPNHELGYDLSQIVNHPGFPKIIGCCGCGGTGTGDPGDSTTIVKDTCKPVSFIHRIGIVGGPCIILDITCCDGVIKGKFHIVNCETGEIIESGDFYAEYIGDPTDPNQYNAPANWIWSGSANAPPGILTLLRNANLAPCIK